MTATQTQAPAPHRAGFVDLFTPKLVTVIREGYGFDALRADAIAGLTVAIVALPLSMAIAIASGATPAQGLYTAIVGGVLISALGGSRFQIGGPAGAFIVLVASIVAAHGMDGLFLATMMAGVILITVGLLRLGVFIRFIPYPVTVGFTAGIAVIIFASQIKDLFGLTLAGPEPGELVEKLRALWTAHESVNSASVTVAAATILLLAGVKRWRPSWPNMLIAVILGAAATAVFNLPVETIGSRFGGIPSSLPTPALPAISGARIVELLPSAIAIAMLGAIESLLSAVVADGMTGRRHRSNSELVAQGVANVASPIFGGVCVTGAIARTATNIRAGAHGPVAGILHAVFLLLFILVAAPLASFIPLASLAGILVIVAYDMVEKTAFATLLRASKGDAVILLATFLLTIFRDLTEAIVVGVALGSVLFIHRMSGTTMIAAHDALVPGDVPDDLARTQQPFEEVVVPDRNIAFYRITGAFFFAAAASAAAALDRVAEKSRMLIIDLASVPLVDSTAARSLETLAAKLRRRGGQLYVCGASADVRGALIANGVRPPLVLFEDTIAAAAAKARASLAPGPENAG